MKKRLISIFLTCSILFSLGMSGVQAKNQANMPAPAPAVSASKQISAGTLLANSNISTTNGYNIGDVLDILKHLAKITVIECEDKVYEFDLNDSEHIDIGDVLVILRALAKIDPMPERRVRAKPTEDPTSTTTTPDSGNPNFTTTTPEEGNPNSTTTTPDGGNPNSTTTTPDGGNPNSTTTTPDGGNPNSTTTTGGSDIPTEPDELSGTITIGTNHFNAFLNFITFGLFFNNTQTVTITVTGNQATIQYAVVNIGGEFATEQAAIDGAPWQSYTGSFSVEPGKFVIYAKLTDADSNVMVINSNGVTISGCNTCQDFPCECGNSSSTTTTPPTTTTPHSGTTTTPPTTTTPQPGTTTTPPSTTTTTPPTTTTPQPVIPVISVDPTNLTFNAAVGYSANATTEQFITVTNTSTIQTPVLSISLTAGSSNFTLHDVSSFGRLNAGESRQFRLRPVSGLAAGTHTGTITIAGDGVTNMVSRTVAVSFTVTPVTTPSISLSPTSHTFPALTAGYSAPTAQTITVTNTSTVATGALTVALTSGATSFTISETALTNIQNQGSTRTFTVAPRTGLAAGTYTGTITVSGTGLTSRTVSLSFTVNPVAATPSISLSQTGTHTFSNREVGYTSLPTAREVTVTNTSTVATGALTVALSGTNASSFTLSATSLASITSANGTRTFTVVPRTGLAAGTYTATVTVSGTGLTSRTFNVSFTVTPVTAVPSISLSHSQHAFSDREVGYTSLPTARVITVTNTGTVATGALTVAISGNTSAFTVSVTSLSSIAVAGTREFTIVPRTGLSVGTYTATVTVSGTNITARSVVVSFTVTAATVTPSISVSPSTITFSAAVGYSGSAEAQTQTITVTNTSTVVTPTISISLTAGSANFTLHDTSSFGTLAAGANRTFRLRPVSGLAAGTYNATITVSGTGMTSRTVSVAFTVTSGGSSGTIPANRSAAQVVANMGAGINLGNHLDAYADGSTSYSNPINGSAWSWLASGNYANMTVTQMETAWIGGSSFAATSGWFDKVWTAGFRTVRIPVTWHKALSGWSASSSSFTIRSDWMTRVKAIVDMAYDRGFHVILNSHHDEYIMHFNNDANTANAERTIRRLWNRICQEFNNGYGERLIFEVLNEPRIKGHAQEWEGGTRAHRQNLNRLNQAAVESIRATGGNNANRILMIPTYAASSDPSWANNQGGSFDSFVRPIDRPTSSGSATNSTNKFILSIHSYTPGNWSGITGTGGTWSTSNITDMMTRVRTNAQSLGMPVVIGEWGAVARNESRTHSSETMTSTSGTNNTNRADYARVYVREATSRGFVTVWWDTGQGGGVMTTEGRWGLFDRRAGNTGNTYSGVVAAIMLGRTQGS
jgi:hypothetical protein